MSSPPSLSIRSGHGSVIGIGYPHGSEKNIPQYLKTMRKITAIWFAVEECILLKWKIYLNKSIAILSSKLNKFVFSDGQSTTYFTYTDKIHTVLDSTLRYSAVLNSVFHHPLQLMPTFYPEYNGHVYIWTVCLWYIDNVCWVLTKNII